MRQDVYTRMIALAGALCLISSVAIAAKVHFTPTSPTFTDQGLVLLTQGKIAGLGNRDVTISVSATADSETICTNQGGNQAPGQNPGDVTVEGSTTIPADRIDNGQLFFAVVTQPPEQPTAAEAGCPNENWTGTITDLDFTTATVTVEQGGVVVLQEIFTL
jgi:hypothetical protein